MRKIIVLLSIILVSSGAWALSLNLDPPSLQIEVAAGESYSGVIHLKNLEDKPTKIRAYTEDWLFKPDGTKEFKAPGSVKRSCAQWIHLTPEEFTLNGGEEKEVTFVLTVPPEAEGGHWAVIFFETDISKDRNKAGMGVVLAGRIGTLIYQETKGKSKRAGFVSEITLSRPDENKPLYINYTFQNDGDSALFAAGNTLIMDYAGKSYGKADIGRFVTLPYGKTQGKTKWLGDLPEGNYNLILTLDFGGDGPASAEKAFSVKKDGKIDKVRVNFLGIKGTNFFVDFVNSGNINMNVRGDIIIRDATTGNLVGRIAVKEAPVGAGGTRTFAQNLPKVLPVGAYKGTVTMEFGNEKVSKDFNFFTR